MEFTKLWYHKKTAEWLNKCSKNDLILDVGIGKGHYLCVFPKGPKYVLGDIKIHEDLLRKMPYQYGTMHICQLDAHLLLFKNESFDIVLSHQTIEHLNNPSKFIDEVYRVLRKGGKAIISTVIKGSLAHRKVLANNHISEFESVTEFVAAFCGRERFHLVSIEKRPINFPFKKFLPRRLVNNLVDVLDEIILPIPLYYYDTLLLVQKC